MSVPTRTPLGPSTLVRKWYLDVNSGTAGSPTWLGVFGILNFQPTLNPTMQDDSDFDSLGWKSSTGTALEWGATLTVSRKQQVSAPTQYDPGQELLRTTAYNMGTLNSIGIRFYEMTPSGPRVEAYSGNVAVTWSPSGGAMDALDEVAITLTGQGQRQSISHPDTPLAPTISSVTPNSVSHLGGATVAINGTGFLTATNVKVGGTNVTAGTYSILSDGLIVLSTPAVAAGASTVAVVNPTGTSANAVLTYT